jgi:hypothetical protein
MAAPTSLREEALASSEPSIPGTKLQVEPKTNQGHFWSEPDVGSYRRVSLRRGGGWVRGSSLGSNAMRGAAARESASGADQKISYTAIGVKHSGRRQGVQLNTRTRIDGLHVASANGNGRGREPKSVPPMQVPPELSPAAGF